PRDSARAALLFARACDAGAEAACARLGAMVANGEGVDANPLRARDLRERSCRAHEDEGCRGLMVVDPDAPDGDRADARKRLDHLCEAEEIVEACMAIGVRTAFWRGEPSESGRGMAALVRACKLGNARGCMLEH